MDLWTDQDFPVLRAAVTVSNAHDRGLVLCEQVVALTGLPFEDVVRSVRRLGERYLYIEDAHTNPTEYFIRGVTADGLEVAGVWPNPDALQQRFVEALERLIDETPSGSPKAQRLEGVLKSVRDLSTGTGGNVFGQLIMGSLGA